MIQSILVIIMTMSTTSWASPMKLKDMRATTSTAGTFTIQYGKEKAVIEPLADQRYRVNGVVFAVTPADTVNTAIQKLSQAYKASKKKNALLESLLMRKAHAAPPVWFSLLFGGMLGAGLGRASCPNGSAAQGSGPGVSY